MVEKTGQNVLGIVVLCLGAHGVVTHKFFFTFVMLLIWYLMRKYWSFKEEKMYIRRIEIIEFDFKMLDSIEQKNGEHEFNNKEHEFCNIMFDGMIGNAEFVMNSDRYEYDVKERAKELKKRVTVISKSLKQGFFCLKKYNKFT